MLLPPLFESAYISIIRKVQNSMFGPMVPVDWGKPSICVFGKQPNKFSRLRNPLEIFFGILDKSKKAERAANKGATDWGNLIWRVNGQTAKFANKWAFGLWAIPSYLSGRKFYCQSNIWPVKFQIYSFMWQIEIGPEKYLLSIHGAKKYLDLDQFQLIYLLK